ncbi:hypothetical protein [uncultured Bacteroides sp.]|uniref:hypothetical protein n=1 Tax=uncultured Bacteroides sp. TaxID=162156 RepID=UPI0023D36EFF|nr:hypothetical protein [uncultured Bacteroides sp.]MDE6171727.1 hypothetical protein [Bacteroides sp.]
MEEQIKHVATCQKRWFIGFCLLPVVSILIGENCEDQVGMYAADARAVYISEALDILLTAVCVPVSLKLFAWVLTHKIDAVGISDALRLYSFWSKVRLGLLALPVLAGFAVYYLMLSNTGVLCAFIALTASLFCLPGEARLRKELCID